MVSDGTEARIGTLTSGREWFKPWRTVTGETLADSHMTELQVMLEGVFEPSRFLSMVRDFIVFDDDGSSSLVKKMAGYHQTGDTLQHLPEYLPGHCHLSKLKHQPPGMPHQTSTHLDELGLHASQ